MTRFALPLLAFLIFDPAVASQTTPADSLQLSGLSYRMVGPFRGGRSTAVTGIADQPDRWYMGTTGGGVWTTDDSGAHWHNISDGYFGGSIGAIDVADSDPNVIYVGTGSACIRGNTSTGHGAYRSLDGGKTWQFIGLEEAGQIGALEIHPSNPDVAYVAALGHAFGKNEERGIFRTKDGGENWEHVLALSDSTGGVSLSMNPNNPREIYAGMWRGQREPWRLLSGSTDGGVYKTTDGGDTWDKLGGGLPDGIVGKVGVSVSPANPNRVWAIIEAEPGGGVYRSEDGGKTWRPTNSENKLRQRAWYYTHVVADPGDENTVYVLNTRLYRSVDGGKTFDLIEVPHGDVHDLWINPDDPTRMVVANDGGGQVSVNNGRTFSSMYNQPTAELYGVAVDDGFPYRLYGAQQDNTTISVPGWTSNNTLYAKEHWMSIGGCETGPVAMDPSNPDIIYAGCYGGVIDRMDMKTGQVRNMIAYPQLQLGEAGKNLKYRFQWVSPMAVSRFDNKTVYHGSQHVLRSKDEGMTWEEISPDLTTNNPDHQDYSGGPINHDITGVEIFNVVFVITESPHAAGTLWVGTDDGRVHITRDDGGTWTEITPPGLPELATVNSIDASTHAPGTAYLAAQKYRLDDFSPQVYKTTDYGATWTKIVDGIPDNHPVRVVRQDPDRQGLLYAGTEFGVFVSLDDGQSWRSLQLNLPVTPVTDLRVVQGDLALSTQGRSFWVLDDITPLHQMGESLNEIHLFKPRDVYRVNRGGVDDEFSPAPAPAGATVYYYLPDSVSSLKLEVLDQAGRVVTDEEVGGEEDESEEEETLPVGPGLHRVVWDLNYDGPEFVDGTIIWGYSDGAKAPPGEYTVLLTSGEASQSQTVRVLEDPRLSGISTADYAEQLNMALQVRDTLTAVHASIKKIRSARTQIEGARARVETAEPDSVFNEMATDIVKRLTEIEEELMQTKNQSGQDPIRFAPRLDNQFVELYGYITKTDSYISGGPEGRPTRAAYSRRDDLNEEWNAIRRKLEEILNADLPPLNRMYLEKNLPVISVDKKPSIIG